MLLGSGILCSLKKKVNLRIWAATSALVVSCKFRLEAYFIPYKRPRITLLVMDHAAMCLIQSLNTREIFINLRLKLGSWSRFQGNTMNVYDSVLCQPSVIFDMFSDVLNMFQVHGCDKGYMSLGWFHHLFFIHNVGRFVSDHFLCLSKD